MIDVPKFHLYSDPNSIPEKARDEIARKLCGFLRVNGEEAIKLRHQLEKKSRSRKLAVWLDKERCDEINQWWFHYAREKKIVRNALFFLQDYQRSYPFGKLLGQLLHTVREEKDAKSHQPIPTGGLELVFDKMLQGKEGKRLILRSPRHPMETGNILSSPEDGADVYLTINHCLQAIAEEEICKAVKNSNAKGGWAILMEPKTGEIWALAQYPWFEPGKYRDYFNEPRLQENTKVKAIADPYEPGSTMKPLTIALALKANAELKKQGEKTDFFTAGKDRDRKRLLSRPLQADPRYPQSRLSQYAPRHTKVFEYLHGTDTVQRISRGARRSSRWYRILQLQGIFDGARRRGSPLKMPVRGGKHER